MAVKPENRTRKKGGVNHGVIFLAGILFLAGSIIIYFFILQGIFGRFNTRELIPDIKIVKEVIFGEKASVAILYSQYTENMLPEGSTWLNDNITTWKKSLGNMKVGYDIISDEDIETGKHFKYKVVILPGSRSLSDREIVQIKKYIDEGGSVFATSGTASYSDDGKWRGWEFFSEVFGLDFSKEIENDNLTKIHTLRGGLPITANIPTGYPLKVATWDRPMSVEVLDPRTSQVSFWYNYRLEDGLVREEIKKSAGIVYGTYGKGRFVWMGFEINSVIGVQEDYIYFDRLFNNCVNWLSYNPIAYLKDWPAGHEAAAILVPTLTEEIGNVRNIFGILKSENVKATFFVEPGKAEQNPALIKSLTAYGDVSAIVDIGYLASVNDTVNKLDDYNLQFEKFRSAKAALEAVTDRPVNGALPYYGLFDQNTLRALIDAKYKYVLTDSLTDRSVPRTVILGENRIISMTKTARDDYEVIRDFGLTQPEFQLYTYQEDVDRVLFEGGLYVLKLHSDYQLRAGNAGVVKEIIKDLKRKKIWITTASEIEKWYAKRNYVEIRVDRRGERRVAVTVSNPGVETVDGIIIDVDLNDDASNLSLNSEIIGTKPARFEFDKEKKIAYLFIDDLKPGESRTYYLDYDKNVIL
ncbi:MAG: polysaccharide deacetylase family protein [Ignavibacteriaceae bacterium]